MLTKFYLYVLVTLHKFLDRAIREQLPVLIEQHEREVRSKLAQLEYRRTAEYFAEIGMSFELTAVRERLDGPTERAFVQSSELALDGF